MFQHLQIHFKSNSRNYSCITDCSDVEILKWIDISDYGKLTRIEHIENDYSNVHTIQIYAEDEFCNEKSLSVSVPLENVCVYKKRISKFDLFFTSKIFYSLFRL